MGTRWKEGKLTVEAEIMRCKRMSKCVTQPSTCRIRSNSRGGLAKFALSPELLYIAGMLPPLAKSYKMCMHVCFSILPSTKGLFGNFPNKSIMFGLFGKFPSNNKFCAYEIAMVRIPSPGISRVVSSSLR